MSSEQTIVTILSEDYIYTGKVLTKGYRLADLLNDQTTEVLEMIDLSVALPSGSEAESLRCDELILRKESILLVIPRGSYEAPVRRLYNYVVKHRYEAKVILPGVFVTGTLHLPSRATSWMLVSRTSSTPSFVAMTDVKFKSRWSQFDTVRSDVVIFNRKSLEGLYLGFLPVGETLSLVEQARRLRDDEAEELAQQLGELAAMEPAAPDFVAPHPEDPAVLPSQWTEPV